MYRVISVTALALALPALAAAQPGAEQVERATAFAIENFELGDYDAARVQLEAALADLDAGDPAGVPARLLLGVAHVWLGDEAAARGEFAAALALDAGAALPELPAADKARGLFERTRDEVTAAVSIDCDAVRGILHELIASAEAGGAIEVTALAGAELGGAELAVRYAPEGAGEFAEAVLERRDGCRYAAEIPAEAVVPGTLRYFVVARNTDGRVLASRGNESAPIAVAVSAAAQTGDPAAQTGEGGEAVENEIPDALEPARPPAPRKSGCAGCRTGGPAGGAPWLVLAAAAALALGRRRRR